MVATQLSKAGKRAHAPHFITTSDPVNMSSPPIKSAPAKSLAAKPKALPAKEPTRPPGPPTAGPPVKTAPAEPQPHLYGGFGGFKEPPPAPGHGLQPPAQAPHLEAAGRAAAIVHLTQDDAPLPDLGGLLPGTPPGYPLQLPDMPAMMPPKAPGAPQPPPTPPRLPSPRVDPGWEPPIPGAQHPGFPQGLVGAAADEPPTAMEEPPATPTAAEEPPATLPATGLGPVPPQQPPANVAQPSARALAP